MTTDAKPRTTPRTVQLGQVTTGSDDWQGWQEAGLTGTFRADLLDLSVLTDCDTDEPFIVRVKFRNRLPMTTKFWLLRSWSFTSEQDAVQFAADLLADVDALRSEAKATRGRFAHYGHNSKRRAQS